MAPSLPSARTHARSKARKEAGGIWVGRCTRKLRRNMHNNGFSACPRVSYLSSAPPLAASPLGGRFAFACAHLFRWPFCLAQLPSVHASLLPPPPPLLFLRRGGGVCEGGSYQEPLVPPTGAHSNERARSEATGHAQGRGAGSNWVSVS